METTKIIISYKLKLLQNTKIYLIFCILLLKLNNSKLKLFYIKKNLKKI